MNIFMYTTHTNIQMYGHVRTHIHTHTHRYTYIRKAFIIHLQERTNGKTNEQIK